MTSLRKTRSRSPLIERAPSVIQAQQQPFLLCILRILARCDIEDTANFNLSLAQVRRNPTPSSLPLIDLVDRCLNESAARDALMRAGLKDQNNSGGNSTTLPDFHAILVREMAIGAIDQSPSQDDSVRAADPRKEIRDAMIPSTQNERRPDRPLRYEAYEPASPSSTVGSSRSTSSARSSRRRYDEERREETKRILEQSDRGDSRRERAARGGRGGIGESVLGAGALALLSVGEGVQDADKDFEDSSDNEGLVRPAQAATATLDATGEDDANDDAGRTPMQRSVYQPEVLSKSTDVASDLQRRERTDVPIASVSARWRWPNNTGISCETWLIFISNYHPVSYLAAPC